LVVRRGTRVARRVPYPIQLRAATSWEDWGDLSFLRQRSIDAMRKWCRGNGFDYSVFPEVPRVIPPPPHHGPKPSGLDVKKRGLPADMDWGQYALGEAE
jgi:hypothetical protein